MSLLLAVAALSGCGQKSDPEEGPIALASEAELGPMVASVAGVSLPEPLQMEGYGLVGGLAGTGSADCPPEIRSRLRRYVLSQVTSDRIDVDEIINSPDTAVVWIEGQAQAAALKGEAFDVKVTPVRGGATISLHGGWLYPAELHRKGTFGVETRALATVEGPVFVNVIGTAQPDMTDAFILGGGRVLEDYVGIIGLRRANYRVASRIRNRINERYGTNVATSASPSVVEFHIPPEYRRRKLRFISMIGLTYLEDTRDLNLARVNTLVQRLAVTQNRDESEMALEAIGRETLAKLGTLLQASDEDVRFRAARCLLNLRDDRALEVLRATAMEETSGYRLDALEAVVTAGRRNEATTLARRLLRDRDTRVVLAAYNHLRDLGDMAVRQTVVGRGFYVEEVVQTDRKAIFVSRSGDPRVVLFGAPLTCSDSVFVESPDKRVVITSRPGQNAVSVMAKHPTRPTMIGPLSCGFDVGEIVRKLGAESEGPTEARGLGVSYTEIIGLLEQLSAKGAVAAEFWAGPLPEIGLIVKK